MRILPVLLLLVGCASSQVPTPVVPVEAPERIDPGASSVESEIGGMSQEDVEETFAKLQDPILRCVRDGAARVREMGGRFAIKLRIARDGTVRTAYLSESTLGDRETELCVLSLARETRWPRPKGGEGVAERSFDVDASVEPIQWKAEKAKSAKKNVGEKLKRCALASQAPFVATAYIDTKGRVVSAGVAPPDAASEEKADCVVQAVRAMKFRSPGGKPAKITFEL
jgi:hypothetical protein